MDNNMDNKDNNIDNKDINTDLHTNLPSKISHIKNVKFLDYTFDPTCNKYVKEIYLHSVTKLNRDKYDLVWQYYRNRHKSSVAKLYRSNLNSYIRVIYFNDPIIYFITVTEDMVDLCKKYDDMFTEKYKPIPKAERRLNKINSDIAKLEENGMIAEAEKLKDSLINPVVKVNRARKGKPKYKPKKDKTLIQNTKNKPAQTAKQMTG